MPIKQNGDVRTALCEANPTIRTGIHGALFARGIRDINVCKESSALIDLLGREIIDLVICDAELPGMDFCDLVQLIRQNSLGRNPFALIIATVNTSLSPEVRKIINAGVDGVICKPMSMSAIGDQVNALLQSRRPFVATDYYVGPNRRSRLRHAIEEPIIHVPNSLRSKIVEKIADDKMPRLIQQGWEQLQSHKIGSAWSRVDRLSRRILGYYKGKGSEGDLRRDLDRIVELAVELLDQPHEPTDHRVMELLSGLVEVSKRLAKNPAKPNQSHIDLLANLAKAIASFDDGRPPAFIAASVAAATGGRAL